MKLDQMLFIFNGLALWQLILCAVIVNLAQLAIHFAYTIVSQDGFSAIYPLYQYETALCPKWPFCLVWIMALFLQYLTTVLLAIIAAHGDENVYNRRSQRDYLSMSTLLSLTDATWYTALALDWLHVFLLTAILKVVFAWQLCVLVHFSVTPSQPKFPRTFVRNAVASLAAVYTCMFANSLSIWLYYKMLADNDVVICVIVLVLLIQTCYWFEVKYDLICNATYGQYLVYLVYGAGLIVELIPGTFLEIMTEYSVFIFALVCASFRLFMSTSYFKQLIRRDNFPQFPNDKGEEAYMYQQADDRNNKDRSMKYKPV